MCSISLHFSPTSRRLPLLVQVLPAALATAHDLPVLAAACRLDVAPSLSFVRPLPAKDGEHHWPWIQKWQSRELVSVWSVYYRSRDGDCVLRVKWFHSQEVISQIPFIRSSSKSYENSFYSNFDSSDSKHIIQGRQKVSWISFRIVKLQTSSE